MKLIVFVFAALILLLAGCVTQATPPPTVTHDVTLATQSPPSIEEVRASSSPSIPVSSGEVEIPFETVARDEYGGSPDFYQPELLLLTSLDEATPWKDRVEPSLWGELQQVDFDRYAVIAVFRGFAPSSNYPVTIQRISRQANRLIVQVLFWYPNPYWASTGGTLPYHLVQVRKDDLPPGTIELVFQAILLTPVSPTPTP